ncbi:hypothetical protein JTE90_024061, partial [Oedothorax gibbosus]
YEITAEFKHINKRRKKKQQDSLVTASEREKPSAESPARKGVGKGGVRSERAGDDSAASPLDGALPKVGARP